MKWELEKAVKIALKELIEDGLNYRQVADQLNKDRMRTPRGKKWTNITVSQWALRLGYRRNSSKNKPTAVKAVRAPRPDLNGIPLDKPKPRATELELMAQLAERMDTHKFVKLFTYWQSL